MSDEDEFDESMSLGFFTEPIPPRLHSVETGERFSHCMICRRDLLEGGVDYAIQKSFANGETVLECAICLYCGEEMQAEMSVESRHAVQEFVGERFDYEERATAIESGFKPDLEQALGRCDLCGRPNGEKDTFTSVVYCTGGSLLYLPVSPVVFCGACEEAMQECFSQRTRGFMDGFMREYFPGPPAMEIELPKPYPVMI